MSNDTRNKLAILIPTIEGREHFLEKLYSKLQEQIMRLENPDDVLVIIDKDQGHMNGGLTIGAKRNKLMQAAIVMECTHRAFIDDDDDITDDYIELNMPGVYGDYDCNSLIGRYYENGKYDRLFIHDLKYKEAYTDQEKNVYIRFPNHLNVTKIDLIREFIYHEKNFGEDMELAERVSNAGVLKTQYQIGRLTYHYYFRSKPNGI
jgi:hypothetical protein